MKLVYSNKKHEHCEPIHRFTILEEFSSRDREVLKKSLQIFFDKIGIERIPSIILVLDFSDCILKMHENRFQDFVAEIKNHASAQGATIIIAQSDIESIHAENKALEQALQSRINILENKLNLIETVKKRIDEYQNENIVLKEQLKDAIKREAENKKGARGIFDKLWSDS